MMSFEEFLAHYKRYGKTPHAITARTKPLTEEALAREYQKYLVKEEKLSVKRAEKRKKTPAKTFKVDEQERAMVQAVRERDGDCVMTFRLDGAALRAVKDNPLFKQQLLDVAHIIARSSSPKLKYDPDNGVLLNRLFHSRLDSYQNPITGEPITALEREHWWQMIVGKERYARLQEKRNA